MNLRGLEALRAFMEGGSLGEAARRLHRTQPQVSRLLASLEEDIGFPLFSREKRHLVPTEQARELYPEIERALRTLEDVSQVAQRMRDRKRRHVRVLTAPHVTDSLIADAIVVMRREDPGFSASIDSRSRIDIELWLAKEQFDLAITVLPLESAIVDIEPLVAVDAVAVLTEDHPLARRDCVHVTDLADIPFIATSPRSVLRQRLDQLFREYALSPAIAFETPNGLIACQLAGRDLGVTVADGFIARSSLRPGLVMRRFEPTIQLRYVLLYPKGAPRSKAVQELTRLIRSFAEAKVRMT